MHLPPASRVGRVGLRCPPVREPVREEPALPVTASEPVVEVVLEQDRVLPPARPERVRPPGPRHDREVRRVVVVIGLLLSMIITKLIGRLIILIVVVALGAFVWQQRSSVLDNVCKKQDLTFAGVHVKVPADVQAHCKDAVSKVK